ncbi:MAG: tRNA (adenosine(37)-N6)-threonylcarbamoyltransferase complex ATPase subunit type 1 TsaE [Chlamydiota bacterium]|nr:tRNA (adenosine(37)-N6)-threonylcarbamoyltransferase complex ATPase subunit type 1 TsaE [Chlamydiota bacterium]
MAIIEKIISHSESETYKLSFGFGQQLEKGSVVCLFGDLGAGKTTFIKGLAAGAAGYPSENVSSPTFVYLNVYEGTTNIYHFDLYRLRDSDEFLAAGFDEYLHYDGICCIEWSEKIAELIPEDVITIHLSHVNENSREIIIQQGD